MAAVVFFFGVVLFVRLFVLLLSFGGGYFGWSPLNGLSADWRFSPDSFASDDDQTDERSRNPKICRQHPNGHSKKAGGENNIQKDTATRKRGNNSNNSNNHNTKA